MNRRLEESIEFVARHYRAGALKPTLRFAPVQWWRRRGVAAAASVAAVLLVSAAVLTFTHRPEPAPEPAAPAVEAAAPQSAPAPAPTARVERIEIADAPLGEVMAVIESTYGVRVSCPEAEESMRVTLSYEGTAADLVATINSVEGTHIIIEEP